MEHYISAKKIYNGVLLGAKKISNYRQALNLANRFPVPDRDTGDNLYYQMSKIRKNLTYNSDINRLLSSVSEIAVLNSRGNSGVIFSQFFVGLEKRAPKNSEITVCDLVLCFKDAYQYSVDAITNPITEGTILMAIKTWSESLEKNLLEVNSVQALYDICFRDLTIVVEDSKNVLKQQKQSKYSDSGASAFLYFIEGFMSAIVYDKEYVVDGEEAGEISVIDNHFHEGFELSKHRFCTEILLKKNTVVFDKTVLDELGDSLIVSESNQYLKLHIHTDKPCEVTRIVSKYGEVVETKCDDMKIQSLSGHIGGTALLIDSIADIPETFYTDNTYMIPVNILIDNVTFKDKRTIYPELLMGAKATSSQPTMEELRFVIEKLLGSYDDIVILTVSSKMSGLYNQYKKIVTELDDDRVHLLDTKLNSVAEGLVVYKAVELIKNKVPATEVMACLSMIIKDTTILVGSIDLDRMVLSGRLHSKIGKFLKWLGFSPIISIDDKGEGKIYHYSFSNYRNRELIMKSLLKNIDNIEYYSVVHSDCVEEAENFAKSLERILGYPPLYISDASYVIKNFSGKGSIAVGYTLKEKSR